MVVETFLPSEDIQLVVSNRRHYYAYQGQLFPSVTTVLQAYPKPALLNWAVKATAEFAVRERAQVWAIAEADEDAAIEVLKQARWKISDVAKNRGTNIHALIADGGTPTPEEQPYLDSFQKWMVEAKAVVVAQEIPVVSVKYAYGGKVDLIADTGFGRLLLDVKTGSGVYDDAHLQVSAYMHAEVGLPLGVQGCGVLHVQPELTTLHLTSDPEDGFVTFRALRKVAEFAGMLKRSEQ